MTRHYRHSPSAASRHLACPGSMFLPQDDPEGTDFADEGTAAHDALYAWCARGIPPDDEELLGRLEPLWRHTQDLAAQSPLEQRFEVTIESMREGQWGGTPDHCCLSECGTIAWIDDLKYGAGVKVWAEGNAQLLSYAGLCLETWTRVETFILSIWQPRIEGGERDVWEVPASKVREWVFDYFATVNADNADKFAAGDHCRWCRAKSVCPELYRLSVEQSKIDFATSDEFTSPAEEAEWVSKWLWLLSIEKPLRDAVEAAKERLLNVMRRGGRVPGKKAIRRLGHRAWSIDEKEVIERFSAAGVSEEDLVVKSLASPAQVEKKTKLKGLVEECVSRPDLGVALVDDSARGEEVVFTTPEQDFA